MRLERGHGPSSVQSFRSTISDRPSKPTSRRAKDWSYLHKHRGFPNKRRCGIKWRHTHAFFPRRFLSDIIASQFLNGTVVPSFQHRVSPQLFTAMVQTPPFRLLLLRSLSQIPCFHGNATSYLLSTTLTSSRNFPKDLWLLQKTYKCSGRLINCSGTFTVSPVTLTKCSRTLL